jgi:hypothetical protein
MLVALGFLSAGLLTIMFAPAVLGRAVRMTERRFRERLPVSEEEVRADKDRLRAEAAIRIHKLEARVEQAELQRARHRIELSRRDDSIAAFERTVASLTSSLDEHQNARRVLEQTVSDRLPKVEQRLAEAKGLLFNRDREIAELSQSTKRQQIALEEAHSINTQQHVEMTRLSTALTTRGARNAQSSVDPAFESELALRAEIEALRAKTGEQASLINRLQSQMNNGLLSVAALSDIVAGAQQLPSGTATGMSALSGEMADGTSAARDNDVRALQAKCEEQADELVRLTATLKTYQAETTADPAQAKESRIALKARLNAAEAVATSNSETIRKLRTELAAANERLALQASHFMDEMRRLGAGTLPTSAQQRRPVANGARRSLAERVSQARPALTMVEGGAGTVAEAAPDDSAAAQSLPAVAVLAAPSTPPPAAASEAAGASASSDPSNRPRLLDRISSLNKS